ncbi:hypothetical protein POJ06DRAFT_288392 [Lipomyces tetrasporus]|uniref:Uncharacterized protein n=1 Tax=Lipomyces tetrasporus TaxID=54092 RepID=A0AAD7QXX1_9ASCO|nr:uncharacterized protein POJ06DRAFT_288392 [Lipomyces tetrasporus]KAJ8103351.1 hypothetical protein POJ06DRAFT_288392 [Lipomyces tetrasporus]
MKGFHQFYNSAMFGQTLAPVYFYNNDGASGKDVAALGWEGYAYHFTAEKWFPGEKMVDTEGKELWIVAGSCKGPEYPWRHNVPAYGGSTVGYIGTQFPPDAPY